MWTLKVVVLSNCVTLGFALLFNRGLDDGLIEGGKLIMRQLRTEKAKEILMSDATLLKTDSDLLINWYNKQGGRTRAMKEFWMINVHDTTIRRTSDENLIYSGTVGDSTLKFVDRFSEERPLPALIFSRKTSPETTRGTVIVVFYHQ